MSCFLYDICFEVYIYMKVAPSTTELKNHSNHNMKEKETNAKQYT